MCTKTYHASPYGGSIHNFVTGNPRAHIIFNGADSKVRWDGKQGGGGCHYSWRVPKMSFCDGANMRMVRQISKSTVKFVLKIRFCFLIDEAVPSSNSSIYNRKSILGAGHGFWNTLPKHSVLFLVSVYQKYCFEQKHVVRMLFREELIDPNCTNLTDCLPMTPCGNIIGCRHFIGAGKGLLPNDTRAIDDLLSIINSTKIYWCKSVLKHDVCEMATILSRVQSVKILAGR